MKKIIGFCWVLLLMSSQAWAQIDKEKAIKPKHELKIADLLYAQSHYYSAAEYYKEVVRQKPENRYAKYWLAMSTLKAGDYENAVKFFKSFDEYRLPEKVKMKRIEKENVEIFAHANYYYGVSLKHMGDYEKAIQQFEKFKAKYTLEDSEVWKRRANNEIEGAQWAMENPNKRKVKIKSLGEVINTGYEDAAPMPINDSTIYYTSLQRNDLLFIDNQKDIPNYRLYQSQKIDGVWQKGKLLPESLQDKKFGTGNSAISEDGNRLYFCKCFHNEVDEIICNLYLSEKKNGNRWDEPVALNAEINSPKYTSTQPTVRTSGDGMEIVYFVSDREGGKGGMDIWYFIRTARGDYKGPRLLGGGINTEFDELTPFYDNLNNLFYFSSNGHPGIGGFDVFMSKENEELGWEEPMNVGLPVNSPADDLYYVKEKGKTSGFLVSNRDGSEKIGNKHRADDLFYFEDFKYGLEGSIFKEDEKGTLPLEGATVKLYTTDAEGKEVLVEELLNVKEEYFFNLKPDKEYKVEIIKPGYSSQVEYVSTLELADEDTILKDLRVSKTSFDARGSVYASSDTLKTQKLDNAVLSLLEVLPNGTKRNISTKRLPEGSTDFAFNLESNKEYILEVSKDGYFKNSIPLSTKNLAESVDYLNADVFIDKIEVGKSYEMANILYDFGKATLRDESKLVLNDLLVLMQENPKLIIELGSHTDNIGSDDSNLKLSQARAQSCVDYLISKGISKSRLSAKGYGESVPVAPNENEDGSDNEEGRQKNRRTEFKILESF